MFNRKLIEILNAKILEAGLTSTDLGKNTGVTTSTIHSLLKIAEFFNITVSELIGEIEISSHSKVPLIDWKDLQSISTAEPIGSMFVKNAETGCFCVKIEQNLGRIEGNGVVIVNPALDFKNNDLILVIKDKINIPAVKKITKEGADNFLISLNPASNNLEPLTPNYQVLGVVCMYKIDFI